MLQSSALKSPVVQYNSWHAGTGIQWTGEKSYWLEVGEEVRDGRAERSSASCNFIMPEVDGTGSSFLLDLVLPTLLKKWSSDIWEVAFFSFESWMTRSHWIAFWMAAAMFLYHSMFRPSLLQTWHLSVFCSLCLPWGKTNLVIWGLCWVPELLPISPCLALPF